MMGLACIGCICIFLLNRKTEGQKKGQDLAAEDEEAKIRLWAGQSCVRIERVRERELRRTLPRLV